MRKLRPLSPEIEALLAASRAVLPLAPSVQARAAAAAMAESPEPVALRLSPRPPWVFAAAAGLVVALGAAAYAARTWFDGGAASPTPAHLAPVRSRAAMASHPTPVAAVVPDSEAPAQAAPPMRRIRGKSTVARPTNAELQLLLSAREDLTHGDFVGALAVSAEHARRFRNGSLIEEREALRVKSLAGLGRHADAQRAAARFHERFPYSVLLSTFDRMKEPER